MVNKKRINLSWVYGAILLITLLSGCYAVKSPQEIAQYFWDAMKVQDVEKARSCSTVETRNLINTSIEQFRDASVTLGKVLIDGEITTIETTLHTCKNGTETTLPLFTILKKEEGLWRVDYLQTKNTIREDSSLSDIARDLEELGKKLSDRVDTAVGEIKQKISELQEKVKKLGETASKKIDEAWRKHAAEIKKEIEELGKVLEDVLEKAEDDKK